MQVLGISGGRRLGNSETLVKEALMEIEEQGGEVEFIRLMDINIKPPAGDDMPPVSGDSAASLRKKMAKADGIILGAPVFCLTAPGFLMNIRDRVSIRHSVTKNPHIGALIAVGGTDWVNLALPTMYLFLPQGQTRLVDQMLLSYTSHLGQVVLNKKAIARARKLGKNVSRAIKTNGDAADYVGDEYWTCPICYQNLLKIRAKQVECPICDIKGKIEVQDDDIKITFAEEDIRLDYRWGEKGLERHAEGMKWSDDIYIKSTRQKLKT
jgi:multimeric flavodoxin WrbA